MSGPEEVPPVGREDDEGVRLVNHSFELKALELREREQQEEARRRLTWLLPLGTIPWLGLIVAAILMEFITGVQVGIALGAPGAVLLTLLGYQVAWADRGPATPRRSRSGRLPGRAVDDSG